MGNASRLHHSVMKSALILAVVIGIVAYADAAKISVASGKLVHGTGGGGFTFTSGTNWAATETCTFTSDRPIFTASIAAHTDKVTSITVGGNAKLATRTGETDSTGRVVTVTGAGTPAGAGGITVVTFAAG